MYSVKQGVTKLQKRKIKIRSILSGTPEKPRLSVFRSNKYIYAQLIDDLNHKTLLAVSSEVKELHKGKSKSLAAGEVGALVAKKALEKGIKQVAFDRAGYKYHGRVKSLADAAREGGLSL